MKMSKIIDGIYLGSYNDSINVNLLIKYKIGCILNVAEEIKESKRFKDTCYMHIKLRDENDENILSIIPKAIHFINNALSQKKNILIHCYLGVSRSSSIVIAYLIYLGYSFDDALFLVQRSRPIVNPNRGFIRQLKILDIKNI